VEAESAVQNVAGAQRIHNVDPGHLNLKPPSAIPSEHWLGAAGYGHMRHAPLCEPVDRRVRIGQPSRN
jgi:hypothetical protein